MRGTIIKNVIGLHAEESRDSEQVTQAVMGQAVEIEKDEGDWLYVRTWDTYHGWIESRWVVPRNAAPERIATVTSLFTDAYRTSDPSGEIWTKLVITTTIEALEEDGQMVRVRLPAGQDAWVLASGVEIAPAGEEPLPLGATGPELVRTAKRFLGVPYLWGGTSPFGLDCSGFVQLVYKINGVSLLRDAGIQADDPRAMPVGRDALAAGDLVFFAGGTDKTKVTHLGMACGDGTFTHSDGGVGVTINHLTDEPYSANFWGARRMAGD